MSTWLTCFRNRREARVTGTDRVSKEESVKREGWRINRRKQGLLGHFSGLAFTLTKGGAIIRF